MGAEKLVLPKDASSSTQMLELARIPASVWSRPINGTLEQALAALHAYINGQMPHPLYGPLGDCLPSPISANGVRTRSELGSDFDANLRLFGRLMAVVLRLGGSLVSVQLPVLFVALIISVLPDFPYEVPTETVEAAYYIQKGATDVLGVLGFRALTDSRLKDSFGL